MEAALVTVREALASAVETLAEAGCDTPRLDAELLLADALGADRGALVTNAYEPVTGDVAERFGASVRRRAAREPVAYIRGRQAFRYIELAVDRRVLIPRPDSETLVEAALEVPEGARVHDVGTGSGCVALALKHERPDLEVSGSDLSATALEVARENAERLGLDVAFGLAGGLPDGGFDLVTANLPYVCEADLDALEPELRLYEPLEALVSGSDGLDAIRELVASAPRGLRLALEHAPDQAAAVRGLLSGAVTHRDLAGRERVTVGVAG